jgi:hypothetical protein
MSEVYLAVPKWWLYGRPAFWLTRAKLVGEIAAALKAKRMPLDDPLPIGKMYELCGMPMPDPAPAGHPRPIPRPFPGVPVPHLHYKGELYLLTRQQWEVVSGKFMDDLRSKLGDAKSVSFEKVLELSDAIDPL